MEMALRDWNKLGPRRVAGAGSGTDGSKDGAPSERREVVKLLAMWSRFAADGIVPSLDDLKLFLGADGWNRRFLVAQDSDPSSSVLLTCGPGLISILGETANGRTLRDLVWEGCRPLFDACIEAARRRQPITIEGLLRSPDKAVFPFRALVLPFGSGQDSIPYLFGTVSWIAAPKSSPQLAPGLL
jgi:hypothetical protein